MADPAPVTPKHTRVLKIQSATPNRPSRSFSPSTAPPDSTTKGIQRTLAGHVAFNEPGLMTTLIGIQQVSDTLVEEKVSTACRDPSVRSLFTLLKKSGVKENKLYEPLLSLLNIIGDVESTSSLPQDHDYSKYINRAWIKTHSLALGTDPGIFVPGRAQRDEDDGLPESQVGRKRSADSTGPSSGSVSTRSMLKKIARRDTDTSAPLASIAQVSTAASDKVASIVDSDVTENQGEDPISLAVIDDRRPDLTLIDLHPNEPVPSKPYGRLGCIYFEVKVSSDKCPNPIRASRETQPTKPANKPTPSITTNSLAHSSTPGIDQDHDKGGHIVKEILGQIGDVARLHLATRPFLRYSLHITLCGTVFNVCLFDRAGAIVSEDYDIIKDLGIFVRLIRRVTCEMDAYDLGLDRTVVPLSCLGSVQHYPRFKVFVGEERKAYYTRGLPIWQSTSLCGRGSFVCEVTEEDDPTSLSSFVLKNAWRSPKRLAESLLYKLLHAIPRDDNMEELDCVATFVKGGDVVAIPEPCEISEPVTGANANPGQGGTTVQQGYSHGVEDDGGACNKPTEQRMRISTHRARCPGSIRKAREDSICHRLILSSRGRSMVSYTKTSTLLRGAKGAAKGLYALWQRGVHHRDVSIGNVYLSLEAEGPTGFIADLDLSTLDYSLLWKYCPDLIQEILDDEELEPGTGNRTGTAIFMSMELVKALLLRASNPSSWNFRPSLECDLESLVWVILYAMMARRLRVIAHSGNQTLCEAYERDFNALWGSTLYFRVMHSHQNMHGAAACYGRGMGDQWFPDPVEGRFFSEVMWKLAGSASGFGAPFTYQLLDELLDRYIALAAAEEQMQEESVKPSI